MFFRILTDPLAFIIYWIFTSLGYFFVLGKMPLKRSTFIIPFLAEREMTKVLFRTMRSFWRPFIISVVFAVGAIYLGADVGMGRIYALIVYIVYGVFLTRLHWRLAKSFGKGTLFRLGTIFFPPLFMTILGLSKKAVYTPLKLRPVKKLPPVLDVLAKIGIVLISGVEIFALVFVVGFVTIRTHVPGFLVDWQLDEFYEKTKNIDGTKEVVSREDAMGKAAASIQTMETSREKFFPDHSQDKSVVVLTYIVGANLEDNGGYASANIRQMKEATAQGSALKFVVQAGGSKRWFTEGIDDSSYGRYEIKDGSIEKKKELPDDISMSDEKSLEDFLLWAKKKYKADRYMLVLWDHGGGVALGYGSDDLNEKTTAEETDEEECMNTSEVIRAIKKSGIRFDLIGFDACLMQDIEIAASLEPYTDYYLASEEVEGGYGWYYTSPFGKLADNPGMSTEAFAIDLLSCYDQVNTIVKDDEGKPDTKSTLSLVDTTLAKPAYEEFEDFLEDADKLIKESPGDYADMAVAGTNAYNFNDNLQIDLIDYLKVLNRADYGEELGVEKEKKELINKLRACILYRNKNSAKGVNGIAFAFPYKAIEYYSYTSKELKSMALKTERRVFNDIFSIMAAQKQKSSEENSKKEDEESDTLTSLLMWLGETDYTEEDWYVKGFEDYNDVEVMVDIPLTETENGFKIELPDKAWDIITDCQTMVWQKTDKEGELRYLGSDHIGGEDENGHPTIGMDESWIHINGEIVCYQAEPSRDTDEGVVYSARIPARLNGEDDIMLLVEWDPIKDGDTGSPKGHVTGYYEMGTELSSSVLNARGTQSLNTGDTLQFIFDTYDTEGNVLRSKPQGNTIRVIKQSDLIVEDSPLGECDIVFDGVLTDVYQRTMTTEQLEMHID